MKKGYTKRENLANLPKRNNRFMC